MSKLQIVGSKECHVTGRLFVELATEGEATTVSKSIVDIITDDHLLEQFTPLDIRLLTVLACQRPAVYPVLKRMVGCDHRQDAMGTQIHVADSGAQRTKKISLKQLANAQHLLAEFSPQDAYRIGYLHAMEGEK